MYMRHPADGESESAGCSGTCTCEGGEGGEARVGGDMSWDLGSTLIS